jgi:hypothetical protein
LLKEGLTTKRLPDTRKEEGINLYKTIIREIDIKRIQRLIVKTVIPIEGMTDRIKRNRITGIMIITLIKNTRNISSINITNIISITITSIVIRGI